MIKNIELADIPSPKNRERMGKNVKDIEEFVKSGACAAEIVLGKGETSKSRFHGFCAAIARMDAPVKVATRRDRLFFLRKDAKDAE